MAMIDDEVRKCTFGIGDPNFNDQVDPNIQPVANNNHNHSLFPNNPSYNAAPAGVGLFFPNPASSSANASAGGGLLVNQPTGLCLFGGPLPLNAPASHYPGGGGLFGAPASGGGLFGAAANAPANSSGGGLFGAPANASVNPSGGGLFGAAANASANPSGGGLFGAPANAPANASSGGGGGLFGAAPSNPPANSAFAAAPFNPPASGVNFGPPSNPPAHNPFAATSLAALFHPSPSPS